MRRLLDRRPFVVTLPTIGMTVSDVVVSVCVSGPPVRITGVCRTRLDPRAADRRDAVLAAARDARRLLCAPLGTPAVLALEPVDGAVRVPLTDGWGRRPLAAEVDPDVVWGVEQAGFTIDRYDALPAALARFAWCSRQHQGRIRAEGWQVHVSSGELRAQAERGREGTAPLAPKRGDRRVPSLTGVRIPHAVHRHLRSDVDAGAIGAALRAFDFWPDLLVEMDETT